MDNWVNINVCTEDSDNKIENCMTCINSDPSKCSTYIVKIKLYLISLRIFILRKMMGKIFNIIKCLFKY